MSLVVERFLVSLARLINSIPSYHTHILVAPEGTYNGVRDVFRELVSQSHTEGISF